MQAGETQQEWQEGGLAGHAQKRGGLCTLTSTCALTICCVRFAVFALQVEELQQSLLLSMLPHDQEDEGNVILEIRSSVGGEWAGGFAADLLEMYRLFAANNGWRFEVSTSQTPPSPPPPCATILENKHIDWLLWVMSKNVALLLAEWVGRLAAVLLEMYRLFAADNGWPLR